VYEICQRLLDRYNNEGKEEFLSRIVTGDETLVHHYEPESKRESMEWKHPGSPTKKKFKQCINGSVARPTENFLRTFFVEGIRKLVDRWTKCIEKEGDYVEK
jgi:hypothetical protein